MSNFSGCYRSMQRCAAVISRSIVDTAPVKSRSLGSHAYPVSNILKLTSSLEPATKCNVRLVHTSQRLGGLEEFFESQEFIGKNEIKSAAPWSRDLLRLKSNEDLHKLWFILLKERNMLETMQYHYESVDEPMPSPERLEKVAESMSNLRDVLEEREKAQNMLLYGRPTKHGGEYRKSPLGAVYWYEYKEHLIPKHLQENLHGDQPADIATHNQYLEEWHLRFQEKRQKVRISRSIVLRMKWGRIRKNNPHLPKKPPAWWVEKFRTKYRYGIHPELMMIK